LQTRIYCAAKNPQGLRQLKSLNLFEQGQI